MRGTNAPTYDDLLDLLRDSAVDFGRQAALGKDAVSAYDKLQDKVLERYVLLPVDADGQFIHVGDEVVIDNYAPKMFRVVSMRYMGAYIWTIRVRDARACGSDDYEKYPLLTFSADKMRHASQK